MATLANWQSSDTRQFTESNYLLPHTYVDMFATEIQSSMASRDDHVSDDSNEAGDDDTQAAHTLNPISKDCSKNWKAAASDEKKRMWAIFDETGIFVAACRHGLILWYTDMVKSGELYIVVYFPCHPTNNHITVPSIPWQSLPKSLMSLANTHSVHMSLGVDFSQQSIPHPSDPTLRRRSHTCALMPSTTTLTTIFARLKTTPLALKGPGSKTLG
jgi:hypothetical protein